MRFVILQAGDSFAIILRMLITVNATNAPAFDCDICGQEPVEGERVYVTDGGLTVEHAQCSKNWFANNFGRETLHA